MTTGAVAMSALGQELTPLDAFERSGEQHTAGESVPAQPPTADVGLDRTRQIYHQR